MNIFFQGCLAQCDQVLIIMCFPFALESGKLLTWGSTDDMGQSYVTAGKHEVKLTCLLPLLLSARRAYSDDKHY
jgi:hypothetical protein